MNVHAWLTKEISHILKSNSYHKMIKIKKLKMASYYIVDIYMYLEYHNLFMSKCFLTTEVKLCIELPLYSISVK